MARTGILRTFRRETDTIREFDIRKAYADMRSIVHQPFAVDHPLLLVSHVRDTIAPRTSEP
jgi:hypothetical protein